MFVGLGVLFDRDAVRVDHGGGADDEINAVSDQLVLDDLLLGFDDMIATLREILERDVLFDPVAGAIEIALAEPGQKHHRFAE